MLCLEEKEALQSLCSDERVNAIIFTGGAETAKQIRKQSKYTPLMAEAGGKNAMIITAMADEDQAIKDVIHSAFLNAGQKCSSCSLLVLESSVYDDPKFKERLIEAAKSLTLGSPWELDTLIEPLIKEPSGALKKALENLEKGESWALAPIQNPKSSRLLAPVIKWGVKPSSFSFKNELFDPLLSVARADSLECSEACE